MSKKILIPLVVSYCIFTVVLLLSGQTKMVGTVKKAQVEENQQSNIYVKNDEAEELASSTEIVEASGTVEEKETVESSEEAKEEETFSENLMAKEYFDVPCYNDNRKNVMIRVAPNLSARIIGKIKPRDTAMALHIEKDIKAWEVVSYNGIKGYSNVEILAVQWEKAEKSKFTEEDLIKELNAAK